MNSSVTPTTLYKYLGPRGVRLLTSLSIRFSPPTELNDPFESRLPEVIHLISRASGKSKRVVLPEAERTLLDEMGRTYGITCFSEVPDDLLIWAHYGENHSGLVVGFKVHHDAFTALGRLLPVSYLKKRPMVSSRTPEESFVQLLTTKSRQWRYEREWRVLTLLADCRRKDKLSLKSLDPACIESVILGVRAGPALRRKVAKWKDNHPEVRVLQARLDSLRFGLYLDDNLKTAPAIVVTDRQHVPVAFNLPFMSHVEMRDGALLVRDITAEINPKRKQRRQLATKRGYTDTKIIIYGQPPKKRQQRTTAKRAAKSAAPPNPGRSKKKK